MKNLILTIIILISGSLNARFNSAAMKLNPDAISQMNAELISAVQSNTQIYDIQIDLSDFRSKVRQGLNFMYPGSTLKSLNCESLTKTGSQSISGALESYLTELYRNEKTITESGWVKNTVAGLMKNENMIGVLQWEIDNSGKSEYNTSVAVFDKNWNVIFDTKLINFITSYEENEITESDNNSLPSTAAIISVEHQNRSRTLTLNGVLNSSVQLRYQVRLTAEVAPYILASTNDAVYNYYTEYINCDRINPTGPFPPAGEPFAFFGVDGAFATFYNNATPYKSPISFTKGTGDRFNAGVYRIDGTNGQNWSFSFDFSVDLPGGGIGITPVSNISPMSLSANTVSSINMLNYVYNNNVITGDVRAVYFDGGSLNADNFYVKSVNSSGETESINISSRLQAGYMAPNATGTLVPNFFAGTSAATFNFSVSYLRGDFVLQPEYKLTSTRYKIALGQIDTLKAKITNKSHVVQLNGGNISIDVSSLNNNLTLLSAGTLSIGTIDTSATKEFKFVIRGNSNGIVTPQMIISSMGWSTPVPPYVLINNVASIDSNIEVGVLNKTLNLSTLMEGFYNSASNTAARDTVRVYLRNSNSPYAVVDVAKAFLSSAGNGVFTFANASNLTPYYIQVKHRNSIETWSKNTEMFINSALSYDFTLAETQAFGDNLIQVDSSPVKFAVYGGDVNNDGTVDASDLSEVENAASEALEGYVNTDVTGDDYVDATDLSLVENNAANSVNAVTP